ncbi:MAG: tRNA uridine-5-carboxymethylaminomethyl(34) synthesis GTPase MnmE, partial [Sphingomonadales bacterium]|nr:tRNA uridine-5-carboxymethylaminomethyl(34) synthesis GTPase MnmE [Sphingomonadales bacterium]
EEGVRRARLAFEAADIVFWLGTPDEAPQDERVVRLRPKADLGGQADDRLGISAVSGEGLDELRRLLIDRARSMLPRPDQLALNQRQRTALAAARDRLAEARPGDWVLLAESLRRARAELDRLSGRHGVEDMLDALFGQFCIGK